MPNASLSPHRVEILSFANAQLLDVTGLAQVFATVNDLTSNGTCKPYEIAVVSLEPEVVTSSGIALMAVVA